MKRLLLNLIITPLLFYISDTASYKNVEQEIKVLKAEIYSLRRLLDKKYKKAEENCGDYFHGIGELLPKDTGCIEAETEYNQVADSLINKVTELFEKN